MRDKDILNMLGLNDRTIRYTLEEDILNTMGDFVRDNEEHQAKKREFISLFKECFDELCLFMEKDPEHKVPISCYTCIRGMDLSKQYGKPKKK